MAAPTSWAALLPPEYKASLVPARRGARRETPIGIRQKIVVIGGVHGHCQRDLLVVIDAMGSRRPVFCFRQRWQEHRGQNGNDGDDHLQLDKGKTGAVASGGTVPPQRFFARCLHARSFLAAFAVHEHTRITDFPDDGNDRKSTGSPARKSDSADKCHSLPVPISVHC